MTSEFGIAVHALVYLNHKKEMLSSESLAANVCTNPARIRKVMAKLKKSGLVDTKEGLNGGYHVLKSAGEISLGQICNALREKLVKTSWRSGDPDMNCMVASGMADIMDDIYERLNEVCMGYLEHITVQDIDDKIFKGKEDSSAVPCRRGPGKA